MGFALDQIVPWGRSYCEYMAMFGLTEADQQLRILGCGDGPAAFNAEFTRRTGTIVSIDPIYAFDTNQIQNRIAETYETVMTQMRKNHADYVWTSISSIEELGYVRMSAMSSFLSDYEVGKTQGRYIAGELPLLPFEDSTFDLALSSHLLFLYSVQLQLGFHLQALTEMLRVAHEVRIFPLLTLDGKRSSYLEAVIQSFNNQGFVTEVRRVPYEFQRDGNEMLLIRHV
ncbi:MAG: SAM-dependent methyltransferase [Proteobacteria bacterium]|nr:SAM-dependent methyltransferase [Pseudomonadota bacterium]